MSSVTARSRRALYVIWDSENTDYLSSLFLPVFEALRPEWQIDVVHATRAPERLTAPLRDRMAAAGLNYRVLRPTTVATIIPGICGAMLSQLRHQRYDLLIPRSIVPAAATLLARTISRNVPLILWDSDGLAIDERIEHQAWRPTSPYTLGWRLVEQTMLHACTGILCKTEYGKSVFQHRGGAEFKARLYQFSNGRSTEHFRPSSPKRRAEVRIELGVPLDAPLVAFCGTIGGKCKAHRIESMFDRILSRRPDAFLLLLSDRDVDKSNARIIRRRVPPQSVPEFLSSADVGLLLCEDHFSTRATFPIKLGEYLLAGCPVIVANAGHVLPEGCADVVFRADDLAMSSLDSAAAWFVTEVLPARERVRQDASTLGNRSFALTHSVAELRTALDETAGAAGA